MMRRTREGSSPWAKLGICLLGMVALFIVVGHAIGERLYFAGRSDLALKLTPGDWRARLVEAVNALQREDVEAARDQTVGAIGDAPLRAEAATLLAAIEQQQGNTKAAAEIMSQVGSLGWRHPAAQLWILQSALSQRNFETAVLRADALLRQDIQTPAMLRLLRQLSSQPAAAAAIAERLAADPPWRRAFLTQLGTLSPEELGTHQAILMSLRGSETPPTLEEVTAFSERLLTERRFAAAEQLWRAFPSAPASDPAAPGTGSPFEWTAPVLPALSVRAERGQGTTGPAFRLTADGAVSGAGIQRLFIAPAGPHVLRSEISASARALETLQWRVTCELDKRELATSLLRTTEREEGVVTHLGFSVPPSCPAIRATLWIDHRLPTQEEWVISNISLAG